MISQLHDQGTCLVEGDVGDENVGDVTDNDETVDAAFDESGGENQTNTKQKCEHGGKKKTPVFPAVEKFKPFQQKI